MFCTKRGQSVLEYALLIAAIVAGLLIMQIYVKRAFQGKVKESADEIGKPFEHKDDYTTAWKNTGTGTTTTTEATEVGATGGVTSTTNVSASETVNSSEKEEWGTVPSEVPVSQFDGNTPATGG